MPFWTSALSEPKRAHRFLLYFPNLVSVDNEYSYQPYLAKDVTKPNYQVTSTPHKFLGNTYHYPGTVTWGPVTANVINAINPDGNKVLYDALIKSGYLKPPTQEDAFDNPAQAPGTVVIQELSGQGGLVGEWTLQNAFITDAKFGDLSYDNDNLLNISLTIQYDWAEYVVGPAVAAVTEP
jgi:hypothetical protein